MQTQTLNQSIPLNVEPLFKSKGKQGDIILEAGDVVYIPKRPTTVTVLGGVVSNGSVVFQEDKKISHYLTRWEASHRMAMTNVSRSCG